MFLAARLSPGLSAPAQACLNFSSPLYFDASQSLRRYFAAKMDFEDDEKAAAPVGATFDSVIIYQSATGPQRPPLPAPTPG